MLLLQLPLVRKFSPNEPRDFHGRWTRGGAIGDKEGNLHNSLGMERKDMPQIRVPDHEEFFKFAKDKGVKVGRERITVSELRPAQKHVNPEQVAKITPEASKYPIMVSSDNYVLDGTNRWAYNMGMDQRQKVDVIRIYAKAKEALALMHSFPKAFSKDVAQVGTTEQVMRQKLEGMFDRVSKPDGGFTYQPVTGQEPTKGFALSSYPERSFAKDAKDFSFKDLVEYAAKNADVFTRKNHFIGAWHDPETHQIFLDVSVLTEDRKKAERLCQKYDQIAYFDLGQGKSVTVNRNATSGGVAKGDDDGNETKTEPAFTAWWGRADLRKVSGFIQKFDRPRTDSEGTGGGREDLQRSTAEGNGFLRVLKYNPNHDELGRFSNAASRSAAQSDVLAGPAQRLIENPPPHRESKEARKALAKSIEDEVLTDPDMKKQYQEFDAWLVKHTDRKNLAENLETSIIHSKSGHGGAMKPERLKVENDIVQGVLSNFMERTKNLPKPKKPRLVVLAGRGGSGKSKFNIENTENKNGKRWGVYDSSYLTLDADMFKELLAKHDGEPGHRLPDGTMSYVGHKAAIYHEESGRMFDRAVVAARKHKLNVVLDVTMNSPHLDRIKAFEKDGYDVRGVMMMLSREEAARRSLRRSLLANGHNRLVRPYLVLGMTKNEKNFDKLIRHLGGPNTAIYSNHVAPGELPKHKFGSNLAEMEDLWGDKKDQIAKALGLFSIFKHNPYHDANNGRFTTGDKAGYISIWGKPYAAKVTANSERVQRLNIISDMRKLAGPHILVGHYAKLPMGKLQAALDKKKKEHAALSEIYMAYHNNSTASKLEAANLTIPVLKDRNAVMLKKHSEAMLLAEEEKKKVELKEKIARYAGPDAKVGDITMHRLQEMHDTLKATHHELIEQYGQLAGEAFKNKAIKAHTTVDELAAMIAILKKTQESNTEKDFGKKVVAGQPHYMWETSPHPLSMTQDELHQHITMLNGLDDEHQQMAAQYYKNYVAKVQSSGAEHPEMIPKNILPPTLMDWVGTHFPSVESGSVRDKLKPQPKAVPDAKPAEGVVPVQLNLWDKPLPQRTFHPLFSKSGVLTGDEAARYTAFKEHHDAILNDLKPEEVEAIKLYTGTWHAGINRSLGNDSALSSDQKRVAHNLDRALLKSSLGEDVVLTRAIPTVHLMNAMGIKDHEGMTPEALVGKVYGEKGYASTTLRVDDAISGVTSSKSLKGTTQLHINAPKEARGLFVKRISSHDSEQEVLLPRGMQYLIRSVSKSGGGTNWNPVYHMNVDLITV